MKILLGREEVNPNRPDKDGRTPLSFDAEYGCYGLVKTLLGRAEVNPDRSDNGGITPLQYAERNCHWGVGALPLLPLANN